jgi:hypothetical protein
MRIISFVAAFTLATIVCADVTRSNSGVAKTTSLQTRRLRGEVHEARIRRHTPGQSDFSSNHESTSAEATGGGDLAPPHRVRKGEVSREEDQSTENGGGAAFTRDHPSTSTVSARKARIAEQPHGPIGSSIVQNSVGAAFIRDHPSTGTVSERKARTEARPHAHIGVEQLHLLNIRQITGRYPRGVHLNPFSVTAEKYK